jgi:hypothetical protein
MVIDTTWNRYASANTPAAAEPGPIGLDIDVVIVVDEVAAVERVVVVVVL